MNYWLVKSEPHKFSIDDLKRDKKTCWDGVRNYQARNFMRDEMKKGDKVVYYHSSCDDVGAVGSATIAKEAYPDHTQFDKKSNYFDEKATEEKPRWFMVDIKFDKKFKKLVTRDMLASDKTLAKMRLMQKGNRLSVMPITKAEYEKILKLGT